ncbi:MAG TPA: methionyl-tRNA formyltransferase [Pyrinomonadaceae bacterium]|nr:methionyl-tRNA formyltransferase [Pyrinomonadaceae bacterium]
MRIIFMGTPRAAVPILEKILADGHTVAAVWTQPDKPAGRGKKITVLPVKEFALSHNLPVFQPERVKTDDALQLFKSHEADVAVVVAYGRILPIAFLETPKHGCINVHFSLLPKYRGAAPVNWAIVQNEKKTGVTTMRMDAGLDTGDILLQSETEIGEEETAPELLQRLSGLGAELLSETLKNLDELEPRKQNDLEASFAPILKREDGLISWELSAFDINNRVRGFQPFPNAFVFTGDKKLVIWRAEAERIEAAFEFGTILKARGDELIIACGESTVLRLREVQPEGKRRMNVRDFLNGAKIEVGQKLI